MLALALLTVQALSLGVAVQVADRRARARVPVYVGHATVDVLWSRMLSMRTLAQGPDGDLYGWLADRYAAELVHVARLGVK